MSCKNWSVILLNIFVNISILSGQDSTSVDLMPIEITAEKSYTPSIISLSRSQFLSAAASFDDPSRLLIKYPGFSVSNDQNNAIVYDGLPSHFSTWSFYGAAITNPNHLSDAGTVNTLPSRSGGGVNLFSGQVLGALEFHTGISGPAHGIGGVADLSIRTPFENSMTANVSLIGLEAGVDKVFDNGKSTLLANYRYSTVGLLGKLGVDFGDEKISYQDIVAEYQSQWKTQKVRWMLAYGNSYNNHDALDEDITSETKFKDIQNIKFDAKNFISAVSIRGSSHRLSFAFSTREEFKTIDYYWNTSQENILSNVKENITALYGIKSWENKKLNFSVSVNANLFYQNIEQKNSRNYNLSLNRYKRFIDFNELYFELRPTLALMYKFSENHSIVMGTSSYIQTLNDEKHLLPFIEYSGIFKQIKTKISLQNNRQSASPELIGMQGRNDFFEYNNKFLGSINSWALNLDASKNNYGISLFGNLIFDAPVSVFYNLSTSALNEVGQISIGPLYSSLSAISAGAKVYMSFDIRNYRIHANYSIMESYMDQNGGVDSPLDFGQMLNVRLDKIFKLSTAKSVRLSTSYHIRKGYYRMKIDDEESRESLQTVYIGSTRDRLKNYHRLDLRVSYIKKGKWKNVFSLDIQNVLNRQNEGYYYFDALQDKIELQNQLGIIPILSWRVVF